MIFEIFIIGTPIVLFVLLICSTAYANRQRNKLLDSCVELTEKGETMDEIKLKPCPFCGGEMRVFGSSRLRRFTIGHINPRECYFSSFEIDWNVVGSLAEATKAWNRRANDG